jgi:hypothetical protein
MFVDPSRHLLVIQKQTGGLLAIDLDNVAGGMVTLTTSGTFSSDEQYLWSYYPKDGCWYTHTGFGSNVLYKLQPPVINSNPLTGTWTVSQVTLSSSLAPMPTIYSAGNAIHYNRFFFVPSLQCFAWISGEADDQVALVTPP